MSPSNSELIARAKTEEAPLLPLLHRRWGALHTATSITLPLVSVSNPKGRYGPPAGASVDSTRRDAQTAARMQ